MNVSQKDQSCVVKCDAVGNAYPIVILVIQTAYINKIIDTQKNENIEYYKNLSTFQTKV